MGRMSARLVVVLALVAAATGCGGKAAVPASSGAGDGGDAGDAAAATDARFDVADGSPLDAPTSDGAAEREAGQAPSPATFVLTNATDRSIYVQLSGLSGQAYWSLEQGGARLPINNTCEVCDCAECPACAVCGRSLGRVKELKPGDQHQWAWDGRIWQAIASACRPDLACEQESSIAAGADLQVDVTYSFSFAVDPSFGADDQFIGTPLVAATAFTHPPGMPVQVTAGP